MNDAFLPAEWYKQEAIQLTWPHERTDWAETLSEVTRCYVSIAREIAQREKLWIVTPEPEKVRKLLSEALPQESMQRVSFYEIPTNDTWARDHGFISLIEKDSHSLKSSRVLLDFKFNAWGGKFEATLDNEINQHLYHSPLSPLANDRVESHLDFELEGGSIESDGEGTIMTTAQCNLNSNRNRSSIEAVETELKRRLRAKRVLWLHHGALEKDDTDAHIDTLARFAPDNTIVYGEGNVEMERELQSFRTPEGKPYRLISVPPYYANFLIMNGAVLVPFYGNESENIRAKEALQRAFPNREIIGIDCEILLTQNGSLHCCTMQYPEV